jgi:hypothetical protein
LTPQLLQPFLLEARAYWSSAGVDAGALQQLDSVAVYVANLPGAYLGAASSTSIWIDREAAGYGWLVDRSVVGLPGASQSVTNPGQTVRHEGSIIGRMDLLSVVTHEVGHVLGFKHSQTEDVMRASLRPGTTLLSASERQLWEASRVSADFLAHPPRIQSAVPRGPSNWELGTHDKALLAVLNEGSLNGAGGSGVLKLGLVSFDHTACRDPSALHESGSFGVDDNDERTELDDEEIMAAIQTGLHKRC